MVKIGVIGYGYWGPNLVRNFVESKGLDLACVSDLDPQKLELVNKRYPGVKTTTHFEELIRDADIDAVAVATPVSTHFELGMAVLKAGKNLWLEKPMTETAEEAQRLVDEAAKRRLIIIVDHTFIYTGAIQKVAALMRQGEIGDLYYYDSTRINLGLFQRDVGVISDLAVHDFAILDYLTKTQPVEISAVGISHFAKTPENLAFVTMSYDSGLIAHSNINWLAPVKIRQILLGGSQKMIVYDDLEPSEKIKVYDKGISFTTDPNQIYAMRVGYRTGDMWAPQLDAREALRVEGEHFADCIEHANTPETDGMLGLRVVRLIEASTRSMRDHGRAVRLNSAPMWRGRAVA
jgi:predicted dehydrogenase